MHQYEITIIVPVFNVEIYLKQCLDSLVMQCNSAVEIIIIDDGSTDGSLDIAASYEQEYSHIHIIKHSSNRGLGPSRNTGLKAAHGRYIMFVDSDDWLHKDAVKILLEATGDGDDIIHFGCHKVYQGKQESNLFICKNTKHLKLNKKRVQLLSLPHYAWLKIYKREFLDDSGILFENMYYEDITWSIELALRCSSIKFLDHALYYYRQRPGSILNSRSARHFDVLNAFEIIFKRPIFHNQSFRIRSVVYSTYIKSAYYLVNEKNGRIDERSVSQFISNFLRIAISHRTISLSPKILAMAHILFFKYLKSMVPRINKSVQ